MMLFDAPIVPGLAYRETLIDEAEEQQLVAAISALGLSPFRFQGWTGRRLTRSFGWAYDFDRGGFAPAEPIPDMLLDLRAKAARFGGLAERDLVHALVTRYDPGAGIGWHRDRPQYDKVIGVSLGGAAQLRFRRRRPGGFDRTSLALRPRSAYLLTGEVRDQWEHSIAPHQCLRYSITFRSLSDRGRAIASGPPA